MNFSIRVNIAPLPKRPANTIQEAKALGEIRVQCVKIAELLSRELTRLVNQSKTF
jgi:hypothetical protein